MGCLTTFGGFRFLLSKVPKGSYGLEEQEGPSLRTQAVVPCVEDDAAGLEVFSDPQPLKSCWNAAGRGPGFLPRPV